MAEIPNWACALEQSSSQFFDRNSECYKAQNDLFATVTADAINSKGLQLNYYPLTLDTDYDKIMKEDRNQFVERMFYVMGYVPEYPTRKRNVTLEGFVNPERSTFTISKVHFTEASTYIGNTPGLEMPLAAPRVGDLIYLRATKSMFRIIQVRDTDQQFQYSQHTWTITLAMLIDNIYRIRQHPSILSDDPIFGVMIDNKAFAVPLMTEGQDTANIPIKTEDQQGIDTGNFEPQLDFLLTEQDTVTDATSKWISTEANLGLLTEDGRSSTEEIKGRDVFDDHPIVEKTRKKFEYEKRKTEKKPLNVPDNPFDSW